MHIGIKQADYIQQHQLLNLMLLAVFPPKEGNKNQTGHAKIDDSFPVLTTPDQVMNFFNR